MTGAAKARDFLCDGKAWTVARHAATQSSETGLCFRQGRATRFLAFTRGALPSDRELHSLSAEVLGVLLQRAVVR